MGNVKYSKIKTSNGIVEFTKDNRVLEFNCDNYKFLEIYNIILYPGGNLSYFKLYINNSSDYIILKDGRRFTIEDFVINNLKIEYIFDDDRYDDLNSRAQLEYFLCK